MKLPKKGETVLYFQKYETGDEKYEEYRVKVLESGGRLRRAVGFKSLNRHLMVYTPTFIVMEKQ